MIRVLVSGAKGRMGSCVVEAVAAADDLQVAGCYAPFHGGQTVSCADGDFVCSDDLPSLIDACNPDVMVDFSQPDAALENIACALSKGVCVVTGTTGVSREAMAQVVEERAAKGAKLFFAPNFTTGAVLMMQFAKLAGRFFPDVEIVEMHHNGKKDAPSGTAVQTARMIAEGRDGAEKRGPRRRDRDRRLRGCARLRRRRGGAHPRHPRRRVYGLPGGHHERRPAETLSLRHDSTDRKAYMPRRASGRSRGPAARRAVYRRA